MAGKKKEKKKKNLEQIIKGERRPCLRELQNPGARQH